MIDTRRTFIKKAALFSASPILLSSGQAFAKSKPKSLINLGFIGTGKMGHMLLESFITHPVRIVAVCDVDKTRREHAQSYVNDFYAMYPENGSPSCQAYSDFRELIARDDIDAVIIATPDHWHAYPTVAAIRAGKDVYCEKPLTHNIHEAITVMKEAQKHKRIVQTGSMQRSSSEFRIACELVRNGVIGKISHVDCSFGGPGKPCDLPEEAMEPGLDWKMWLGPAAPRPYNSVLSPRGVHDHYPRWRRYKEFGGGSVCDWGAHHLDIAQWGLAMDNSGPVEVLPPEDPKKNIGAVLKYANGIKVNHKRGYGVHFFGENGQVKVNRELFELILDGKMVAGRKKDDRSVSLVSQLHKVKKQFLSNPKVKLYDSQNHQSNFLECIISRKRPITDEIVGARSAICCHLMNLAYYNRQKIEWDPINLKFANGTGNPKWLSRQYESPWSV